MNRNVWLIAAAIVLVLLGINNTVYYFLTKKTLENDLSREMAAIARHIGLSVELSRIGSEKFQEQIGRELRTASIAAQYALDPDIEKVTDEELKELSERLGVLHITLMKRLEDGNIELYRSSDPQQHGIRTGTWKPWHQAFVQLFEEKNVTLDWGQSLPNFWSGPFEFATSDVSQVRKWGYYYDGATNYIIDPYVSYDVQREYEEATGVDKLIEGTLQGNPMLLEITGVNPPVFRTGPIRTVTYAGELLNHTTQQPIIFGRYDYRLEEDGEAIRAAYEEGRRITVSGSVNGKHVLKSYIPVDIDKVTSILDDNGNPISRYVLTITSDYQTIRSQLNALFLNLGLVIAAVTLLSAFAVVAIMRHFRRSRETVVVEAQQTYVEEMNQLFQMMRAQRHDFNNHVQTMHSLAQLNKVDDLKSYAAELAGETRLTNDIINIGNPAIAALVRTKLSQAERNKIAFQSEFSGLEKLDLGVKSLDLTRMIGNLIDNAFDEEMKYPEEQRLVSLIGKLDRDGLVFTVSNHCDSVEALVSGKAFESGFTTKDEEHQGLGLSIVRTIADKYRGSVTIEREADNRVAFVVRIPN